MKKVFLAVALIAALTCGCDQQEKIDQLGEEGGQLFGEGDMKGALAKFEEIIEIDDEIALAHLRKADCLFRLGRAKESIGSYTMAVNLEPENKIAIYNRASAYESLAKYDSAILDFQLAIAVDPHNESTLDNFQIHQKIGILHGTQKDLDKAIEAFSKAIDLFDQDPNLFQNRGYAYQLKGDHEQAIKDFDVAIKLSPADSGYRYIRRKSIKALAKEQ